MAENRGNPSGSNTNMPTGVTKNKSMSSNSFNYIDSKTMKEIGVVNKGLSQFAETLSGSLEKYNKLIIKSSKDMVDTRHKLEKESKELDEQLAEMKKHYFGKNKKIYDDYEKQIEMKKVEMEKELDELKSSTRKEFLKQSFKNEMESHEIKYLDSEFVKNNGLKSLNNEYYSKLEKLKSSALDTYGEDFESKADYKQALINLNDKYAKDRKDAWREDFKENHKILSSIGEGIKDTFDKNKEVLRGFLGPLNLIIEPIKEFFGGFGTVFKVLGGGVKKLFGKFTKKNPNANDVIKSGAFGVGSLYIVSEIKKIFEKDKNKMDDKKGILTKIPIIGKLIPSLSGLLKSIPILGTFLRGTKLLGKSFGKNALGKGGNLAKFFKSSATKTAFKAMGPMMIVTSLIEMAIDGIKGFFKSKEWGTSKISSALGGFLGGATEGGLKSAFSSMGKWALLGAGIGSVVPIVGTIAGGLIGGAIGGILGAFGGKNLAKGFDSIWQWFKSVFVPSFLEMLDDLFSISKFKKIFKSDDSVGKKIGKTIGLLFSTILKMPIKLFTSSFTFFKKILNLNTIQQSLGNFMQSVFNGLGNAWENMKGFGNNVKDKAKEAWEKVKNFGSDVWEGVKESELSQFVSNLFTSLKDGIIKFFNENPVGIWVKSSIITPIQKAFGTIGDFFSYISDSWDWSSPFQSFTKVFGGFKADKNTGLSDFDIWRNTKYTEIEDAIIRTDGSIIKTNPKDTLVALKNVPMSVDKVREDTNKSLNKSITQLDRDETLEKKLTTIIDVLSKILAKDIQVQLPPQTRNDLDMLMSGGMI